MIPILTLPNPCFNACNALKTGVLAGPDLPKWQILLFCNSLKDLYVFTCIFLALCYNRVMNNKKIPCRNVSIAKIPNTNSYSVSFTPTGEMSQQMTFSDHNRAKSFVRRNITSKGAYAG